VSISRCRPLYLVTALGLASLPGCRDKHSAAPAPAPTLDVHVDPRVELLSIVLRLSGAPEYQTAGHTAYVADVDKAFAPHATHPVIAAARALRAEHGISFDAPMTLAINLDDSLHLQRPPDDARFQGVDLEPFLAQLRDFRAQTQFDAFAAAHADYYRRVAERFRSALATQNPREWFDRFFGTQAGARFVVVPGLLTGTWNYGPHTPDERYQVVGVSHVDFDELPVIDSQTRQLAVHEMAHSYVNPLVAAHRDELASAGARLFARVQTAMTKQAYTTWEIFVDEQLVRAVTAVYTREHEGAAAAAAEITDEEQRGFAWTRPLTEKLAARSEPFTRLMPDIVRFFDDAP
jgi:hypothetical protein